MRLSNTQNSQRTGNALRGMTLVEMMVSVGVGTLVLLAMTMSFMTSSRSFAVMGNYINLDRTSRAALDRMTRDIRLAKGLFSFSTNKIVLNYSGSTNLVYAWSPSTRQLSEWKNGDTKTNILLSDCDAFQFSMWRNIPLAGGTLGSASTVSEAKSIGIAWKCSRTVLGKKLTSEAMQQAQIVIRNKPVL